MGWGGGERRSLGGWLGGGRGGGGGGSGLRTIPVEEVAEVSILLVKIVL